MKCNQCGQEIPESSKFCASCGSEQVTISVDTNANTWQRTEKYNTVNTALICSSLSLFFSLILGGYLNWVAILLAPISAYFSIINFKASMKKAVLALSFGILGLLFAIINLINMKNAWKTLEELEVKCQEKLEITIADAQLNSFFLNNDLALQQPYKANEYHYSLTEAKVEELVNQRNDWQQLPLLEEIEDKFTGLDQNYINGFYLIYDNITNSVIFPDLQADYDIILVIIDTQNNKLHIYEFWK